MSTEAEEGDDQVALAPETLNKLFAGAVQLAGVPLAVLGICNIIASHWHVQLLPLGEDIISNYRAAMHLLVGWFYWIPINYFHWHLPAWFFDVAVVSVVSSGVSWRAFAGNGHPLTDWDVSLPTMLQWGSWPPSEDAGAFDWLMYIVTVVPMFFVNLSAWVIGNVIFSMFRVKTLAGVCAASLRVALRGLFLIGVLIFIQHVFKIVAPTYEDDRANSARYFLYFSVVIVGVIYFFGQLGAQGLMSVR